MMVPEPRCSIMVCNFAKDRNQAEMVGPDHQISGRKIGLCLTLRCHQTLSAG